MPSTGGAPHPAQLTASTQTEFESKPSFPFQVPVISIQPPSSNPPSPRTSVVLPPQTKSVSCQTDAIWARMGSRSIGIQTERLPVNTLLIKLRQKALLNSIRSQNEDPVAIGSRLLQSHYQPPPAPGLPTTVEEGGSVPPPPRSPSRANRSGSSFGLRSDLQEFTFSNNTNNSNNNNINHNHSTSNIDDVHPQLFAGQTAPSPKSDDHHLPVFAPPALLPPFEPTPAGPASSASTDVADHASSSSSASPSFMPSGLAQVWGEKKTPPRVLEEDEDEKEDVEDNNDGEGDGEHEGDDDEDNDVSKANFVDELPTSPGLKRTPARSKSTAKRPPKELLQSASLKKYGLYLFICLC